jgi:DNA repair protein RadD
MSPDVLESVLARLQPTSLMDLINSTTLAAVTEPMGLMTGELQVDSALLASLLVTIRGDEMLGDSKVRAQLFSLLPVEELEELCNRFAGRSFRKTADNVLALSCLPWRAGSEVALELIRRFDLPSRYLPKAQSSPPVTTVIRPAPRRVELRDYQQDVKLQVLALMKQGFCRVLVQMPTGAGKTRTAMEMVTEIANTKDLFRDGGTVLWLAHVEELCEQAVGAFEAAWILCGRMPVTVVRAWGSNRPNVDDFEGSFVVSTYQRMVAFRRSGREFNEIRRPVRLVVADEAHKVLAPTFESLLEDIVSNDVFLLGLTATPGRGLKDSHENLRLADFFGKNLVSPRWGDNPIKELQEKGILARISHKTIESSFAISLTPNEMVMANEGDVPGSVLARLAASAVRNRKIVDAVRAEVSGGRTCLLFACTTEHSRILTAILNLEGERAAHIDGNTSRGLRQNIVARFRSGELNVLSNFGVLSTGLDVPLVSAVVIARPTTSVVLYSQMVGRGLRGPSSGGNAECSVVDVRDNFIAFGEVDEVYKAFAPYWL